jgi:starch synthase
MAFLGSIHVPLAWRNEYCGVYQVERDGVVYYFIDNEHYFNREGCYGYFDDGERFAFFSKAVLSCLSLINFIPDVIHAHDWQTALLPIYLRTQFAWQLPEVRSVFTIHNIEYQGKFPLGVLSDVFDLRNEDYGIVEYDGCINLVKGAIICCDSLTTVSPSYAEEIKYGGGYGLEPILLMNQGKIRGIINGIDTGLYDPAIDPTLAQNFTVDTLGDKAVNKRELQHLFGLPAAPRKPVLCMISRLVPHKGLDLLLTIIEELLSDDLQFLLLGTGDHQYELFFGEMAIRYPDKVAVNIAYNPEIGNKIYAGADIMLMPSRSEPCGLSQMIACRYATIPVARATGGLKDTIRDCRNGDGNGFLFHEYDAGALLSTIRQAIHLYTYYENDWQNLMREAMRSDFRWDLSARAYADIYARLR